MDTTLIEYEYELSCSAERAFDVYVNRIGEWWHPDYTANPETLKAVTIEPRVGGRVYATHTDLGSIDWGRVIACEHARRLIHTFTLAQPKDFPSEVSVSFIPQGAGCKVRFKHGGWNEDNISHRSKFSDWPVMLDRFVRLANGTAQTV